MKYEMINGGPNKGSHVDHMGESLVWKTKINI